MLLLLRDEADRVKRWVEGGRRIDADAAAVIIIKKYSGQEQE